jgi:uncharacterized protein YecT (DUF1311 family)
MRIRIVLAGVSIVAAAMVGVAFAAVGAHTLSPPVMHEPFPAASCTGSPSNRSTVGLEMCAEASILASDKKIDTLNAQIFAKLFDNASRRDFVAGHNAWVAYRKSFCQSESDVFKGGTLAGVEYGNCVADTNTEHVKDLSSFLRDLSGTG